MERVPCLSPLPVGIDLGLQITLLSRRLIEGLGGCTSLSLPNLAINVALSERRRKDSSSTSSKAITRGLVFRIKISDYLVKL